MTEFQRLQAKYVSDYESMNKAELEAFLTLLQADEDAPYRTQRIPKIERTLAVLDRIEQAEEQRQAEWEALAYEDKALKERWERLGASFRCNESYCEWYYDGEMFYRWWSRVRVTEEIVRARAADQRLNEIIKSKSP